MGNLLRILGLPSASSRDALAAANETSEPRASQAASQSGAGAVETHAKTSSKPSAEATPPRTEAQIQKDLQGGWDVLNDTNDRGGQLVDDFLREHPDHPAAKRIEKRRATRTVRPPGGRPMPDENPDPPLTDNQKRGIRPRRITGVVEEELEAIVNAKGPGSAEAAKLLEGQRAASEHLAEANRELQAARAGSPSTSGDTARYLSDARELERKANALIEQSTKLDTEVAKITKEAQAARGQFRSGKLSPDGFLEKASAVEKQSSALDLRRQQLSKAGQSLQAQAESTIAKLAQELPTEVQAKFNTKSPKEILQQGRSLPKGVAAGVMGVVGVIATAYFLVESIHYVMEAESVLDGVGRALEVGGWFAVGAAAQGLLTYVAGSAAGGFGLAFIVQMPNDQGEAYNKGLKDAARAQARQDQQRKMAHDERMAIGKFLEETAPGSVTWIEDFYQINDHKLWDRTVAQVHELLAMQIAKDRAQLMRRAREMGLRDGRFDEAMASKDEIKDWPAVKNADDPTTAFLELFEEYKGGHREGSAKRLVLEERATRLGYADAKSGKSKSTEQINRWPEVVKAIQEGAGPVELYRGLYGAYEAAFDNVAARHK